MGPVVRCPTFKYNSKLRLGRGFTLDELKAAGVSKKSARTVGISVDFRRRNLSMESMQENFKPEKARVPSADEKKHKTFVALRQARVNKKLQGMREKKAREAAEKEANK